MHANIVLLEDLLDYAPLFAEIADAYFEREMYPEASVLYELLGEDPVVINLLALTMPSLLIPFLDQYVLYLAERSCLPADARKPERGRRAL